MPDLTVEVRNRDIIISKPSQGFVDYLSQSARGAVA